MKGLSACLMLLALATDSWALSGMAQVLPAPAIPLPPSGLSGLDLGAADPVSAFLAHNVQFALVGANQTGGLPPMPELNTQLASLNPLRQSILGTLPVFPDSSLTIPLSDEMLNALANLKSAQLNEAYGILEGIGYELITAGVLLPQSSPASRALIGAGNELLALGYFSTGLASREQARAAQHSLMTMVQKAQASQAPSSATGGARPESGSNASASSDAASPVSSKPAGEGSGKSLIPWRSQELGGAVDPSLAFGSWQRIETDPSGTRFVYRITRDVLIKVKRTSIGDGRHLERVEAHPGAVSVEITYETRDDHAFPGAANVTVLVEKAAGKSMAIHFLYLYAQGSPEAGSGPSGFDVLVEQDGERKAFIRLSKE